jgi:3',5'-cyclic AMP phosphodiesterase CpdA
MKRIVHISDLHFGRIDPETIEPLVQVIQELDPRIVAISGDLTQRARSVEFQQAREFLSRLPQPQVVVPGNHDIPHHPLARFVRPLAKYKKHISEDLGPFYQDDEIAVLGINTARSLTTKYGRINTEQMRYIRARMCAAGPGVLKFLVTHHPFDLPANARPRDLVGRAEQAMERLAECGVDVLLAGHMHVSHAGHTSERYRIDGYSALFVQAGTATSTRGRGEPNSLNVLHAAPPDIVVERLSWSPQNRRFECVSKEAFHHTAAGWKPLSTQRG